MIPRRKINSSDENRLKDVSHETVRNIRSIIRSRTSSKAQIPTRGITVVPRVISSGTPVDLLAGSGTLPSGTLDTLLETRAVFGACCPVVDHTEDLLLGTGVVADVSAVVGAVVVLHDARVGDAVGGCAYADAAVGFLDDDGEDEARVDTGGFRFGDDSVVDILDFGGGVLFSAYAALS